uniref:Calcineurin-like phosphoesterase domain-containing protein n=1 Tax=Cyprinodon variegatus TaxID=28743 RepID=A0A3Q2GCP1_CYPVA
CFNHFHACRLFVETFSETGTFWFTQAADPQLGLMQPLRKGKCDGEGEGWTEEVPMFMVLCCDLVHDMRGIKRDQKDALKETDPFIPFVFVSRNHDLGNTPSPSMEKQNCRVWRDDYFSFWINGLISCFLLFTEDRKLFSFFFLFCLFRMCCFTASFTGHYHQNAGGCHDGLDTHGVRVVVVTAYSQGTDQDFRELLQV